MEDCISYGKWHHVTIFDKSFMSSRVRCVIQQCASNCQCNAFCSLPPWPKVALCEVSGGCCHFSITYPLPTHTSERKERTNIKEEVGELDDSGQMRRKYDNRESYSAVDKCLGLLVEILRVESQCCHFWAQCFWVNSLICLSCSPLIWSVGEKKIPTFSAIALMTCKWDNLHVST